MDSTEDLAYQLFCRICPHEAYDADPDRFIRYTQSVRPGLTADEIRKTIEETRHELSEQADSGEG